MALMKKKVVTPEVVTEKPAAKKVTFETLTFEFQSELRDTNVNPETVTYAMELSYAKEPDMIMPKHRFVLQFYIRDGRDLKILHGCRLLLNEDFLRNGILNNTPAIIQHIEQFKAARKAAKMAARHEQPKKKLFNKKKES